MKKLILFHILLTSLVFGQSLKLGMHFGPGYVFAEDAGTSDDFPSIGNLMISIIFEPLSSVGIELRPGIFLGTEQFTGIQVGSLLIYKIPSTSFTSIIGMLHHFNVATSGHNRGSQSGYFPFYGTGLGFNANDNLRFELSYFFTSRKTYAGYDKIDYITGEKTHFNKNINGILFIGFTIAFEIVSFK